MPITTPPSTSNLFFGSFVPIPTFPATIKPFNGADVVPEYVDPIATPPSTSNLLFGSTVPIPTLPTLLITALSIPDVKKLISFSLAPLELSVVTFVS